MPSWGIVVLFLSAVWLCRNSFHRNDDYNYTLFPSIKSPMICTTCTLHSSTLLVGARVARPLPEVVWFHASTGRIPRDDPVALRDHTCLILTKPGGWGYFDSLITSACVCHHAPLICPERCSSAMLATHRPEEWGHWSPKVVGRWGSVHWWCGLPFVQHHSHSCRSWTIPSAACLHKSTDPSP